jgi:hypothetical protein
MLRCHPSTLRSPWAPHAFRISFKGAHSHLQIRSIKATAELKCLIFDCDGVILESEDLHRRAYNAAFENFDIRCQGELVVWDEDFYDVLQNTGTSLRISP